MSYECPSPVPSNPEVAVAEPRVEVVPLRPAVRSDAPATLDILFRLTPPEPAPTTARPPLNLGLVIDRSGSMAEANKLGYAREAAAFVVGDLGPVDRVSLTIFDDAVQTLAPNAPVDKPRLLGLIAGVHPGGSTALHGGWAEGANQVASHIVPNGLNRVLLLSDGLANVGESRPDAISTDVHNRVAGGVTTTTLGLGRDYNEDLLEAMARSGDGNYYFVESPAQLATIFKAELHGLAGTVGTDATLAVEPAPGVTGLDVLNDLDKTPDGRLKLPNLVGGLPVLVVVRLTVPAARGEAAVCRFRAEWAAPDGSRHSATVGLTLPAADGAAWEALAPNIEVQERAILLLVARAKKAATEALGRGQVDEAKRLLAEARGLLHGAPKSAEVDAEIAALAALEARLEVGDFFGTAKAGKHEAYLRRHSKPYFPPPA